MKCIEKFSLSTRYYIYALLIFSIYYLLSFVLFQEIVIKVHDNLEVLVVNNHIISKIINGEIYSYKAFLSGDFEWFYLDNIFYPINLFHLILNDKSYYFFLEIIKKFFSYFASYLFFKNFLKDKKNAFFSSILYVTLTQFNSGDSPTIFLSILPYILYLIFYRNYLQGKHYLIIFLVGLNSSLVFDYIGFILILFFLAFIFKEKRDIKKILFVLIAVSISMLIVAIPTILSILDQPIHREEFIRKNFFLLTEIKFLLKYFSLNSLFDFFSIPLKLLKFLLFFSFIFIRNKKVFYFTIFISIVFFLKNFLSSDLFFFIIKKTFSFLEGFNFSRVKNIYPFLISGLAGLILTFTKNLKYKKIIKILIVLSTFNMQAFLPISEFSKEFLKVNLKEVYLSDFKKDFYENNFKELVLKVFNLNLFKVNKIQFKVKATSSFEGYYKFDKYKKIKGIVGESKVASIGLDPMIAVMNNINVIDGYHTIYPLEYKKKFRLIIEQELAKNKLLLNYYDNWGNRVYLFFSDKNNLLINFKEAKNLGADYIISSFKIEDENLNLYYSFDEINDKMFLYKIKS